ncbi:serine hydroxymethyltransferase [Pseudomonas sp. R3-52-08]|uniref:serine hydroxymethyltransferase n=1 Tax=Pseudomonas sp. R3-52-08 TaxID=1173284 RepID=UPI000F5824CD|nr:serine hydroxymethyltransferase [Pseudomonas sp. R3-52-08]AZF21181.1 Serine hydroxymethyltransferase [Pseudomonas sp. R3-52-08]
MDSVDVKNDVRILYQEMISAIKKQNDYEYTFIDLIASDNAKPRRKTTGALYLEGEMVQEGIVNRRPYAGALYHDEIEIIANKLACTIFGAEYANLQPHSCSQANQAVYFGLLENGDRILSLDFKSGGHLTHGRKSNFSGRLYDFYYYGTTDVGNIDYDNLLSIALDIKPHLLLCGSSAYPRNYDYQKLRAIADKVGAYLMCDIAHEAGLISVGALENPVPIADVVTMSLDKTMRGVSSAIILCKSYLSSKIDKGVHPGTQSSFPIRRLADTASTLLATQSEEFRLYAFQTLKNAKVLERVLLNRGIKIVTGGTDKHLLVLDLERTNRMKGARAEKLLEEIGLLTNRQMVPLDTTNKFDDAGGLRLGTAWATSRGYDEIDFEVLANIIADVLLCGDDFGMIESAKSRVGELLGQYRINDVWNEVV